MAPMPLISPAASNGSIRRRVSDDEIVPGHPAAGLKRRGVSRKQRRAAPPIAGVSKKAGGAGASRSSKHRRLRAPATVQDPRSDQPWWLGRALTIRAQLATSTRPGDGPKVVLQASQLGGHGRLSQSQSGRLAGHHPSPFKPIPNTQAALHWAVVLPPTSQWTIRF